MIGQKYKSKQCRLRSDCSVGPWALSFMKFKTAPNNNWSKSGFVAPALARYNMGFHFYPLTERLGGYSDEPGVRTSSIRPSVNIIVSAQ